MAPRGRSRKQLREDDRDEQPGGVGPDAQAAPVSQEGEDLHRLNRKWHIAGALRERILLPRRCQFLMPVPERLMTYLDEAGFGHACQLRDFVFDAPLLSALWSVGGQRPIRFSSRGVSAPSRCRMWHITWGSALTGVP
ncbi:hypothetical protein PIB30_010513 [Stylosanthes scabra]|uniref:Uncharacterized protein n=1 Tax=Stylosanthes scabra TaxID=79078 RepID=A0ABU6Q6B2_9FABA|nr:hypothetical protein [Stylosanthes scabra]